MVEEVENVNMSLRNQAYETAWVNAHKQRYIKQSQNLYLCDLPQACNSHPRPKYNAQYEIGIRNNRDYLHTSDIPNAWPPKYTNKLAGRTAVVTDWYNVSQGTIVPLYDFVEDIHQAIRRRATTENNDLSWVGGHCFGS